MLEIRWESIASHLANVKDDDICSALIKIIDEESIDLTKPASIYFGRDTRYEFHISMNIMEKQTFILGIYYRFDKFIAFCWQT